MTTEQIIQAYLDHLNITEVTNLNDITKLIQAHEEAFAFSSLKVLLQEEITLDLESLYKSLVLQKRGGYCFEHNKLLYEALQYLGFNVEFYLARVINNSDIQVPQTHRFTLLKYGGEQYLIDVGIGFRSPNVPVLFSSNETVSHLNIAYKITQQNGVFYLQLLEKGKWFKATQFDLHPCYEADFELGHFYSHRHQDAVFVNNLVVSKVTPKCIYSLRNNHYVQINAEGYHSIVIKDKQDFIDVIRQDFDLKYDDNELTILYNTHVQQ